MVVTGFFVLCVLLFLVPLCSTESILIPVLWQPEWSTGSSFPQISGRWCHCWAREIFCYISLLCISSSHWQKEHRLAIRCRSGKSYSYFSSLLSRWCAMYYFCFFPAKIAKRCTWQYYLNDGVYGSFNKVLTEPGTLDVAQTLKKEVSGILPAAITRLDTTAEESYTWIIVDN